MAQVSRFRTVVPTKECGECESIILFGACFSECIKYKISTFLCASCGIESQLANSDYIKQIQGEIAIYN